MVDRDSILRRLTAVKGPSARQAAAWLSSADTVSDPPPNLTAHKAAHLWRIRLNNSVARGSHLHGAEALLLQLDSLAPNKKVEQVSFHSEALAGSIFFERIGGQYIGAVMMEQRVTAKRAASHNMADHLTPAGM